MSKVHFWHIFSGWDSEYWRLGASGVGKMLKESGEKGHGNIYIGSLDQGDEEIRKTCGRNTKLYNML